MCSSQLTRRSWALPLAAIVAAACVNRDKIVAPDEPRAGVARVSVSPRSAQVVVGGSAQLAAALWDSEGNSLSGRSVVWATDVPSVVSVSPGGMVTAHQVGTATVTATSEGKSGTASITVSQVPVASVSVAPTSASIIAGRTVQLTATTRDSAGGMLTGRPVTWGTSAPGVATVSSSGLVTGVGAGSASVTATSAGKTAHATVTVTAAAVASVSVSPTSPSVQAGATVHLTATLRDADGNVLTGRTVTWSSDDPTIATVASGGLVTGIASGSTSVTATSEGRSGRSSVTVVGWVLVGAGDIAYSNTGDEATALILDSLVAIGVPTMVFTAGDNAYVDGRLDEFLAYYDPTWGRHKARTRPSPGNHEYNTADAAGYFEYFGALAGPPGLGYYSYDWGPWHIVSLNSHVDMDVGSAQERWLRADLAASTKQCVLAYWHRPRFSSGQHGSGTSVVPLYQALYDYNAEVVVVGHDHNYERFAPQDASGSFDPTRGIRQFVVGTGGRGLRSIGTPIANSEVTYNGGFGVIKFTLHVGGYSWEFVSEAGQTFSDRGSGTCH